MATERCPRANVRVLQKMQFVSCAVVISLGCCPLLILRLAEAVDHPVRVENYGINEVRIFSTAIRFYIDFVNGAETQYTVTAIPQECCLVIDKNDEECGIMELRPTQILVLDSLENDTVVYFFRNLYARYRNGTCDIIILVEGESSDEWILTIPFNTYPNDTDAVSCSSIDEDPDRHCEPVDCAIKYRGFRSFYRNTTGKCEPVVPCHTRGADEISVIAYYDTELNQCHSLDFGLDMFQESAVEIPAAGLHPLNYTEFEDELTIAMGPEEIEYMDCNHGIQEGSFCTCDTGWISSGLDHNLEQHWCDVRIVGAGTMNTGPRKLSTMQALIAIFLLLTLNVVLMAGWVFLFYWVTCRTMLLNKSAQPK